MIRRESSDFLRQKQKQWEREKVEIAAESETRPEWFPFGENLTPGGGSPLRKFAPKEPLEQDASPEKLSLDCSMSRQSSSNNSTLNQEQHRSVMSGGTPEKMEKTGRNPDQAPPTHQYPGYPIYAFPMHHFPQLMVHQHPTNPNDHSQDSSEAETASTMLQNPGGHIFAPQYQVIPAGAIPVSTISIDPSQICPIDQMGMWTMPPPTGPNGMRYGIPIPAPFVPQIMTSSATSSASHHHLNLNHQQPAHQNSSQMIMTTSSTDSSSESGVSGVKDDVSEEKMEKNGKIREEERQSTSDYTDDDPIPLTRRNTSTSASSGCNYQEQIAERRRYEAEQENRERLELLEVERQRRILEDRRRDEEEKRKQLERERLEEDRRRADQFAAAMEKARKEAELLKKAKLYKHVLRGADEEGEFEELEQKILGVDCQTGRRLLKEVSDVEWHKKQDEVEIQKKAPPKEKQEANTTMVIHQHRPRSSSIIVASSPSVPASPFTRNTFGRRSVRTTSREKQEVTVVETDKSIGEQLNRSGTNGGTMRRSAPVPPATPPRPQHHPLPLPNSSPVSVSPDSDSIIRYPPVAQSTPSRYQPLINENSADPMLKSANFYCPINREPLSYSEESRVISSKPTTTQNVSTKFDSEWTRTGGNLNSNAMGNRRENEITQSALFGPISTRLSTRRGQQMRGIGGIQSPPSVRCPPSQQQRRTSSFEESSSGGEDAGSISPDLSHKNFESPLPSSTENVHPAPNSPPQSKMDKNPENGAGYEYGKQSLRTRSALGSPMSMLNGGDSPVITRCSSPSASRLMQRLELKGHVRRDDEHISQDVRRLTETNLSRSPSMASLRGSIQNLSIRGSHLNLAGNSEGPSPNLSKFASVNSPARQSLNSLRKTTDRQAAVLERLGRLRESLHAGKNFTPPRGTPTSRITTPAQTPPISPRPVL